MLVLSRKLNESVVITVDGKTIVCTVVTLRDGKVRLGFTADKSVLIHREEIQRQVDAKLGKKEG